MGYKCKPITQRAKSAPFKLNEALIIGAANVGASKSVIDAGAAMSSQFAQPEKKEKQETPKENV